MNGTLSQQRLWSCPQNGSIKTIHTTSYNTEPKLLLTMFVIRDKLESVAPDFQPLPNSLKTKSSWTRLSLRDRLAMEEVTWAFFASNSGNLANGKRLSLMTDFQRGKMLMTCTRSSSTSSPTRRRSFGGHSWKKRTPSCLVVHTSKTLPAKSLVHVYT